MIFVAYQIINFIAFWLNIIEKILPTLNRISRISFAQTNLIIVWTSLTSMFVITVTVLAKAQPKQSGKFVFTDFIAFITGFINANYSFSCLDAATHISEEIPHPEVNIPKALLTIPIIGLLSSLFYNISMVQFNVTVLKLAFLDLRLRHCSRDVNGKPSSRVILSSTTEYGRCHLLAVYVPLHRIFVSRQYSYMAISDGIFHLDETDKRCGLSPVTRRSPSLLPGQRLIPVLVCR
jgi:hypothetical protein